ncbi:hypothetical protein PR048_031531 [Dryococelus australis]|uniref:Reverse transcriptase n=1 Tax=Dryococelus australis TaxID=614101 RepID=A0ABQ9G5J4_9NEOP|nr:hypothetical protein PR048_031531 [Dryococelus australis]
MKGRGKREIFEKTCQLTIPTCIRRALVVLREERGVPKECKSVWELVAPTLRKLAGIRNGKGPQLTRYLTTVAVSLLTFHQGEPGSFPGRVTPGFSHMCESCRTIPLFGGFPQGSPVSPALSFRRYSIHTSITLIGSQYIDQSLRQVRANIDDINIWRADEDEMRWLWSSPRIQNTRAGENVRSQRKPATQRHHTARFPHEKSWERPRLGSNPNYLRSNRYAKAVSMEQRSNEREGENGRPRENIVRHDFSLAKILSEPAGD